MSRVRNVNLHDASGNPWNQTSWGALPVAFKGPSLDAFARLRISAPLSIFDSKQLNENLPLFWDESLGGSATSTYNSAESATTLAVTASASDFAIRQTRQRFNYQPGKSQLIFMTFYAPQVAGVTSRIGCFDGTGTNFLTPNNGIFFEVGSTLSWNICKNGAITESVSQANWNIDKLDGTGPSGLTLSLNSAQILVIDYEWLGVGDVRVGFIIDQTIHYVHTFKHANNGFSSVYTATPNHPLRYSIESSGTASGQLMHICSSVISEGGAEPLGVLKSFDMGSTVANAAAANTTYALIGLRLKSTHLDTTVNPESFSILNIDRGDFRWSLHLNPTVSGTLTYTDATNSALQIAYGDGTQVITADGTLVVSGYVSDQARATRDILETTLRIGSSISGSPDELILAVTSLSANKNFLASLGVRELL